MFSSKWWHRILHGAPMAKHGYWVCICEKKWPIPFELAALRNMHPKDPRYADPEPARGIGVLEASECL